MLEKAGVARWGGDAVWFFFCGGVCTRGGIAGSRVASTPVKKAAAEAEASGKVGY
jgi:hypothetical protein